MGLNLRVKLNQPGIIALLQSPEISAELERRGNAIAAAAGGEPDFEVRVDQNRDRAVVFVTAVTQEGRRAEAEDRTLTRAIDAGR